MVDPQTRGKVPSPEGYLSSGKTRQRTTPCLEGIAIYSCSFCFYFKQKQTAFVRSHKLMEIDMITIQEVCAKELGDNLQDERPCRPAFSKPCHALSFWVPLGRKMFKFYEGGREVMFNAWMLEEVK
jgi:hypothetical protein